MKKYRRFAPMMAVLLALVTVTAVFAFPYTIRRGDTLSSLARRFNTTVGAIVAANNKITNPDLIYTGDVIEIPEGGGLTPTPGPTTTPSPGTTTYVVRAGDTLSAIARRFGVTVQAIVAANPAITNPNLIYVGQVITIPGGSATPAPTPQPGSFALGGQSQSFDHKDLMRDAGMNWVKIQHKWAPGQSPADVQAIIDEAHNNGFKILLSISGAQAYPEPNSIDFNAFVAFVRSVAGLGPDAIEIWNEQNIDFEWPAGQISPSDYVNRMLAPAYNAIKGENSNVMVVSGALAPTGFDNGTNAWSDSRYLAGMRNAGAANHADCIGVHHNAGATSPLVSTGHPGGSHYSWYFQPTLNLYYNAFGGARKLCFTELGYLSPEGFAGLPAAFGWAANTSVAEHAQWLGQAAGVAASSGKVRLLIVYNVDFTQYDPNGDPQAGYAILRPDGSCPACPQLKAAIGGG